MWFRIRHRVYGYGFGVRVLRLRFPVVVQHHKNDYQHSVVMPILLYFITVA